MMVTRMTGMSCLTSPGHRCLAGILGLWVGFGFMFVGAPVLRDRKVLGARDTCAQEQVRARGHIRVTIFHIHIRVHIRIRIRICIRILTRIYTHPHPGPRPRPRPRPRTCLRTPTLTPTPTSTCLPSPTPTKFVREQRPHAKRGYYRLRPPLCPPSWPPL